MKKTNCREKTFVDGIIQNTFCYCSIIRIRNFISCHVDGCHLEKMYKALKYDDDIQHENIRGNGAEILKRCNAGLYSLRVLFFTML